MATRTVATVFGGSGFIGRYVVQRLAQLGFTVRIAVRNPNSALFLKPMGFVGQIVPLAASITDDALVHRAVQGAQVVVNLVGILAEHSPNDFTRIHAEGAGRVARLSAANGVLRLVHLSAIGANPASPSKYGTSKAAGEDAVRQAYPAASILRPSIAFGLEDQFFNRFAAMAQFLPIMPVICGNSKFQPVYVGDVADAVMACLSRGATAGETFELGGPRVWTFREILTYILQQTGRRRPMIEIPAGLANLQARLGELVPGKPFTRDQLLMLQTENVVSPGAPGLPELDIIPTPVELVVPGYLRRYRPGGGRRIYPHDEKGNRPDLSFTSQAPF